MKYYKECNEHEVLLKNMMNIKYYKEYDEDKVLYRI